MPTLNEHFILNYSNTNSTVCFSLLGADKNINLLVDSGASLCVLKYEWITENPHFFKEITYDKITIKGVSGKLVSEGYIYLNLVFENLVFKEKFYIFKNLSCYSNGILGENFFQRYNAIINYKTESFELTKDGQSVCLSLNRNNYFIHTIPARCEVIRHIPCYLNSNCVILANEIEEGVFVAGMIAKPSQGKLPVRILNTKDFDVKVNLSKLNIDNLNIYEVCHFNTELNSTPRVKTLFELLDLDYLNKDERIGIENICAKYADVFHLPGDKLSVNNLMEHNITLKDNVSPVYVKPYRIPYALKGEVDRQIQEMLDNDIIEETTSEWSSPVLLVPKKSDKNNEKKWRLVIDYRQLNNNIQDDKFPLPNINEILDSLSGSIYFSKLDLSQSYYQLNLSENSRKYTSFSLDKMYQLSLQENSRKCTAFTAGKQYQMKRCPMGLKTSPSVFSRLMTIAMSGLNYQKCFIYLDDCIIIGKSMENHNKNLISVLNRFREVNLKLNPMKCEFLRQEIVYLGHKITSEGIYPDPSKIDTVQNYPTPKNVDEIKRFVAFVNYYRRFINRFADIVHPLNLLCKKGAVFKWTAECESAFQKLRDCLTNPPVLQYPDFSNDNIFRVQTDASKVGLGAILSNSDGRVIAYASRSLKSAETRYPVIELELLAIVWAVKHFRPYLYGRKFKIFTDHRPLVYLFSLNDPASRLMKFRLFLEEYDFEIEYVPGRNNAAADALSRLPVSCEDLKSIQNSVIASVNSVMTRRQKKILNNENPVVDVSDAVKGPDQPSAVELLKRPKDIIELIYNDESNKTYLTHKENVYSSKGLCVYVPTQSAIILNSRSSSTVEVLARELDSLCEKLNIKELLLIKRKNNEVFIKSILSEIKKLQLNTKILICKDVCRIVNDDDKRVILNDFHLLPTSGHAGVNRMTNNIKKYYFWPGLVNDVNKFVKHCKDCQLYKHPNKNTKEPMVITTTATSAFERISLDLMGPLDIDNYDNKYILTIQCDLSKYVEAYPLQTKHADTVAKAFVNNFILKYGIPQQIITDKGTEFMSSVMSETCKLLGIEKINSTPYHHETLGSLENSHKHLGAYLRIQSANYQKDWSDWVQYWCFSYNTSVHTETKYTPYELVFGKLCSLPSNLNNRVDPLYNVDDYPLELKYRLQKAQEDAKQNLMNCKQIRKLYYDKNCNPVKYKTGDLILVKNETGTKLEPLFSGPYKVIEDLSPNVKIFKGKKCIIIHKNNTKLFRK